MFQEMINICVLMFSFDTVDFIHMFQECVTGSGAIVLPLWRAATQSDMGDNKSVTSKQ